MRRIIVFCISYLIIFISSSFSSHASSDQLTGTKTVTTVGIAYIGSEITLEEAKVVALANAQSGALIQLGVFVEASRTVQGFKLSQNEIRSITGAIMKSTVVKEEKKIENDNFILSLTVTSEISMDSLRNALENYQDRSKDRKLIKQLMATVVAMRELLSEKQISGIEELELADEIVFSNERINEFLTTRNVIDKELAIKNVYINKLKKFLLNEALPLQVKILKRENYFNDIPRRIDDNLFLVGEPTKKNYEKILEVINKINHKFYSIYSKYDSLQLNIDPILYFKIYFKIPIFYYINNKKFKTSIDYKTWRGKKEYADFLNPTSDCEKTHCMELRCPEDKKESNEIVWWEKKETSVLKRSLKRSRHSKEQQWNFEVSKISCFILIPKEYDLYNIQDIKIRFGRPKILSKLDLKIKKVKKQYSKSQNEW